MQNRERMRLAVLGGLIVSASPAVMWVIIFFTLPDSLLFRLGSKVFLLWLPGLYVASVVLNEGHGPGIAGMFLFALPLNLAIYSGLLYLLLRVIAAINTGFRRD
jgi:hypothetical protein